MQPTNPERAVRRTYSRASKRRRAIGDDEAATKRCKISPPAVRVQPFTSMKAWLACAATMTTSSDPSTPDSVMFSNSQQQLASSPPSSPPANDQNLGGILVPEPLQAISANVDAVPEQETLQKLIQAQINIGSALQKTCKDCGMTFLRTSADDVALHDKYHTNSLQGLDLGKSFRRWADSTALWRKRPDALIVLVDAEHERFRRQKVEEILVVVQSELGAVDIPRDELWGRAETVGEEKEERRSRYRVLLYLVGSRCVGLCLVKVVRTAHITVPDPDGEKNGWQVTDQDTSVQIGISRIWCSKSHRMRGVATTLLNMAAEHAISGGPVAKSAIAFSQPTTSGTALARRWFGREYGWAVYVE